MFELVARFLLVGAIAFGGGQAALPLVERLAVAETGWLSPQQFATGVGLAYATPGPVLIIAPFIGYHVAGVGGAIAATIAVFTIPILLAGAAAHFVAHLGGSGRFRAFGRFASVAAVGLLGVTLLALARPLASLHPALLAPAALVFVAERLGRSPILLLLASALTGAIVGVLTG